MADSDLQVANLALLAIGDTKGMIGSFDDPSDQAQVLKLIYAITRDDIIRGFAWPWATRRAYPAQLGGALWSSVTTYPVGAYVSYAPSRKNVANPPENVTTFVYLSLVAANLGNAPDSNPTSWRQISRAAWSYVFQLPADVLTVRSIYHAGLRNPRNDEEIPFDIEYEPPPGPGSILLTDAGLPWEILAGSGTPISIEIEYTSQVVDPHQFPPDFTDALVWALAAKLCLALRKDPDEYKKAREVAKEELAEATANALQEIDKEEPPIPSWIAARR